MKKIILALIFLSSSVTYSQNSNFKFGLQGGLNYSSFRGNDSQPTFDISDSPAFAYLGGIAIEYQRNSKLSFKVELNYERKSEQANTNVNVIGNFDDPAETHRVKFKIHYDYIVLPILLKYTFKESNSFYVNGGPFLGYLLKSKIANDLNVPGTPTGDEDTTDLNKKMDYGVSIGLGRQFEIGSNKTFHIEIRENLGLSNTSNVKVWNGGKIKTNSLNLIVGISFI